jgi:hypothetical protein
MKKRDKFKSFLKKTLFGEELEHALHQKSELEKPKSVPPKIENKPTDSSPSFTKTFSGDTKPAENKFNPQVEFQAETKPNENKIASRSFSQAEKVNEFLQIMERGFAENLSPLNPVRVNLGIDLGTSFSKVVWRLGENSYPVCFGAKRQSLSDYLVPSTVAFGEKTLICGVDSAKGLPVRFTLSNFKMCLACESEKNGSCNIGKCSLTNWHPEFFKPKLSGKEAAFINAFFLAKLLTRTKELIITELEKKGFHQPFTIKWTANFAVPEKFIEQSPVSAAFTEVFKIAWLMAEVFGEKPDLSEWQSIFECYLAARDLARELTRRLHVQGTDFDCFAYPEIGAEVASIVRSRISEEGLYAFIDIGAGTVDASVFRFRRENGDIERIPYAADIFKVGAANIEVRADKRFVKNSVRWLKRIKEEYKDLTNNERGQLLKPVVSFLKEAAQSINDETYECLIEVFREAFQKELGKEREDWQNLKLVLGGGGAKLNAYQDAALRAFTLKDSKNPKQPETMILPKPNDFEMSELPPEEFHRFAVAYGLSHEIVNLPETIFPKDVAPIRELSKRRAKNVDWYEK